MYPSRSRRSGGRLLFLLLASVVSLGGSAVMKAPGTSGFTAERVQVVASPSRDFELVGRSTSFTSLVDSLAGSIDQLADVPSILPTLGRVSSSYALVRDHPILHVGRPHYGIDIAAPIGTPVVAPAAGVVRLVGSDPGYGLMLEVEHGRSIVTLYGHLSRVLVHDGQTVTRGQHLADVGSTGVSTGPHLHYEIHVGGRPVDPLTFGP